MLTYGSPLPPTTIFYTTSARTWLHYSHYGTKELCGSESFLALCICLSPKFQIWRFTYTLVHAYVCTHVCDTLFVATLVQVVFVAFGIVIVWEWRWIWLRLLLQLQLCCWQQFSLLPIFWCSGWLRHWHAHTHTHPHKRYELVLNGLSAVDSFATRCQHLLWRSFATLCCISVKNTRSFIWSGKPATLAATKAATFQIPRIEKLLCCNLTLYDSDNDFTAIFPVKLRRVLTTRR